MTAPQQQWNRPRWSRAARRLACVAAVLLLTGCAAPADVARMTAPAHDGSAPPQDPALSQAVCVELVEGGKKTNPLWAPEVDNRSFLKALEGSLGNAGLLATQPTPCRFGVEAHLLGLSQPFVGLDVEVTANVNYRVRRAGDAEPYLLRTLASAYTARFTPDRFLWAGRLKLANEGAVRKNIGDFIDALTQRQPSG